MAVSNSDMLCTGHISTYEHICVVVHKSIREHHMLPCSSLFSCRLEGRQVQTFIQFSRSISVHANLSSMMLLDEMILFM